MGLVASLRDRARVVRTVTTGPRVEGSRERVAVHGDWLPARVVFGASREATDEHGRRRVVQSAQLVLLSDDLRASDRVEVQVRASRRAQWDGAEVLTFSVSSAPEVLRTRRDQPVVTCVVDRVLSEPAEVTNV